MVRTFSDAPFVQALAQALRQSLTAENITQEAAYLRGEGRTSFERPYGLAWLLQIFVRRDEKYFLVEIWGVQGRNVVTGEFEPRGEVSEEQRQVPLTIVESHHR